LNFQVKMQGFIMHFIARNYLCGQKPRHAAGLNEGGAEDVALKHTGS